MDLDKLLTETRSPYVDLDTLSTREILAVINAEDKTVPLAVEAELTTLRGL